ncbi:PREDICTED: mucin-5AC [Rhagoletis zephyria]|uniref:mucin-5AC n=2 Tax=Rhagoletis zephyria TaxID=28612 RepID=UPI00081125B6|nr:PREDICTED: mucin-5AC [Rhagoletis zephyria]
MMGVKSITWTCIVAILIALANCILGQAQLDYRKPWPTYSLQNMPQTRFTCHDKILGGYYADAETQCQMFHVCVKVAGVGVQDFRFLCPNGTAFDQEAQICADWGDVDCESSVLYYGSDNFDLYRLGSGFESKRAPLAEEEEATFHLQRAESGDIRRSKETRIDQKSRPDQPPNYSKHFGATQQRNTFHNNYANSNANDNEYQNQPAQAKKIETTPARRPIVNYYTPTSSTTTTTTSTTTERYFDESKQEYDDIFKGSHSSHFFANRNGGREDDFIDHPVKTKFNDFIDYNKKTTAEISTTGKTRAQPTRPKRIQQLSTTTSSTTTSTSAATNAPKTTKKVTLQTYYNISSYDVTQQKPNTSPSPAAAAAAISTSTATSTVRPTYNIPNRFSFSSIDYQTQEKIEPTTYNPSSSIYRIKSTTPKYTELNRDNGGSARGRSPSPNTYLPNESTKSQNKPTATARKSQKLERTQQKLAARNASSAAIVNEFDDFPKIKLQQPQPFQPTLTLQPSQATQPSHRPTSVGQYQEPQFYRSRGSTAEKSLRHGNQEPAPFSGPQKQRGTTTSPTAAVSTAKSTTNPETRPRGFASRGSINYKATTQRETDYYAPTTSTTKKFSTLVPKSQQSITPTTFKPTTYQKPLDTYYYQTQQTARPSSKTTKQPSIAINNLTPTTANPYIDPDEDDGQYHPELYEIDFPRNRFNLQRSSTSTSTTTKTTPTARPHSHNNDFQNPQKHLKTQQQTAFRKQQEQAEPVDLSDEDELFKTAHSLNFGAASINKLRADIFKAEKTSQQYNSQYSPKVEVSSGSPATSTAYTTTTPSTTFNYYAYSSTTQPTTKLYSSSNSIPSTTAEPSTTVTTRRPTTFATTPYTLVHSSTPKVTKKPKSSKSSAKKGKKGKGASKRPPHADEDTSYDYAYYDTDTLSESPQEYPEYEIAEFVKTRRN